MSVGTENYDFTTVDVYESTEKIGNALDDLIGIKSTSALNKIDKELKKHSDIIDDIKLLSITYVSETEPTNWKAGDWWYQVIRERTPSIEQVSATLQTIPYNPTRNYHLKTKDTIETVENFDNDDLIVKIK